MSSALVTSGALVGDEMLLVSALAFEDERFQHAGYGGTAAYEPYSGQSRVFGCRDADGGWAGVLRLILGGPRPPPAIAAFGLSDEIRALAAAGELEEVASVSTRGMSAGHRTAKELYRAAFRDARARGVTRWIAVMEPRRLDALDRRYGFTFHTVAHPRSYMGGECAAAIMYFDEVVRRLSAARTDHASWFLDGLPMEAEERTAFER